MDILYKDILERLTTKVTDLAWIDYEQGQIDFPTDNYTVLFPCALIDFPNTAWASVGDGVQVGDVSVNIRVAWDIYEDFNKYTPDTVRNAGIAKFQLLNLIHKQLHGWQGSAHYNKLTRVKSFNELRQDGLKVITMSYTTNMRDKHARPEFITPTNLTLTTNIE